MQLKQIQGKVEHLHLVNSYGLFRRMTGVGGRLEVIIEGSNDIDGPWKEYEFLYKPGNVNNSLPFVGWSFRKSIFYTFLLLSKSHYSTSLRIAINYY